MIRRTGAAAARSHGGVGVGRARAAVPGPSRRLVSPAAVARGSGCVAWGMDALAVLSIVSLSAWVVLGAYWWLGMRRLERLVAVPSATDPLARTVDVDDAAGSWPLVSVVVAARDEGDTIEAGLAGLLAQDYPALELILVDDRSVDGTGAAMARAMQHAERRGGPSVRRLRIDALPDGWLGKTHAQARGAAEARGSWLLFVDADVRLAPSAVRAALLRAHLGERVEHTAGRQHAGELDHLGLLPRFDAPGGAGRHLVLAFETAFGLLLTLLLRPWRASDPDARTTLGIGAFGLYRRDAYRRAGGHDAVRLRADDDLALAHSVKAAGGRSLVVFAPELASVTWYPDLRAAVRGLEKNAFAGLRYSPALVALVTIGLLATHVAPYLALAFGSPPARAAATGVALVVVAIYAWYGRRAAAPAWYGLLHPLSVVALVVALLRSTVLTLWRGGIEWRGTRYALADLRAAQQGGARAPHAGGDAR